MRTSAILFALALFAAAPAAAITVTCPTAEFTIAFGESDDALDPTAIETITAALNRSQHCENAMFIVMADGLSRDGPWRAQLVSDMLAEQGIDDERIRTDLLTSDQDRWMPPLRAGAVVVNIYTSRPVPEPAPEPMSCFDVALVARVIRYDHEIGYPNDGQIYMRWPWKLDLAVEQVLIGDERHRNIQTWMSLHTEYRPEVKYLLFFLQLGTDGSYVAIDAEPAVVRDRRGDFIVPFERPLPASAMRPESWIPTTYEQHLEPVRYRAADAWWTEDDEDRAPLAGWTEMRRGHVVAIRGLKLDDLREITADVPNAICAPP